LGQLGDDLLVGGSGRDILIGGMGADRIVGNCDDDILISGTTDHDANVAALAAILAEWTSTRSASERINNLSGTGTGEKANGTYYLTQDKVYDDGVRDVMTGSSGFDWFFANLGSESDPAKDKITDLSAAEFASDLEFIGS
jgi:Ca2+-binding RTX toxin-like protein